MSITRRIAFGAAASWFSRGVTILLGLVLMPVLFRHLPKEELGVWLLLGQSWAALGILDLGFGVTLTRRIAFAKGKSGGDPNAPLTHETLSDIADLVATGRRAYHVLAFAAFAVSFGTGFLYLRGLDLHGLSLPTVWLAWGVLCLSQAFGVWAAVWTCLLQGVGYIGWDAVLCSCVNAITLSVQIIVALCGGGLVGLAVVAAGGALLQRFFVLGFSRRRRPELFRAHGTRRPGVLRSMAPMALRAWLTALGYVVVSSTDQFFIASFAGASELPPYRAALILVINLHFVSGVFSGASQVFVSHLWQAGDQPQIRELLRRNALIGLLSMACGAAAILGLGGTFFDVWLGPGNFVGYPTLSLFLGIYLLEHHANVFASAGRATGDEAYAWTSLTAGLLKIPLAMIGIKMFGIVGVAASTLIAQGVTNSWFMVWRTSLRLKISFLDHAARVLLPCCATFAATMIVVWAVKRLVGDQFQALQVGMVILVSGLILATVLFALVLSPSQRARCFRLFRLA